MKKRSKPKTKRKVLWTVGTFAFVAGIYVIIPTLVQKGLSVLHGKKDPIPPISDEEDWGPEIIKRNVLEGNENGTV